MRRISEGKEQQIYESGDEKYVPETPCVPSPPFPNETIANTSFKTPLVIATRGEPASAPAKPSFAPRAWRVGGFGAVTKEMWVEAVVRETEFGASGRRSRRTSSSSLLERNRGLVSSFHTSAFRFLRCQKLFLHVCGTSFCSPASSDWG
jgi:hypothetical protein